MNDHPDRDSIAEMRDVGDSPRSAARARWRRWVGASIVVLALAIATPAGADAPVIGLRVGSHENHGRLVFDCPAPIGYRVEQDGQRIVLQFEEPAEFRLGAAARGGIRNLVSVREDGGAVVLETAPGARLRHFRLGNRVVIDLVDGPPGAAQAEAAPRPTPAPAEAPAVAERAA
ncbi:hypothetical protein, partial [Neoroseomonas oryzicola]|nr:hypothetical protein [Neoroseomonas oryzicola]